MPNPLRKFKILIADSDQHLSQVLKGVMQNMGFPNVRLVHNGERALSWLRDGTYDFFITDWNLEGLDGKEVIRYMRRDPKSPNHTLPIIMLTGRAEQTDVIAARDLGINEYAIKPFTARALYKRLERVVEHPRYFIINQRFIGPDRRNKIMDVTNTPDRRVANVLPQSRPNGLGIEEELNVPSTQIWLPDFALKRKLGKNITLESIITPEILTQAQNSIESISDKSLQWVKDDLVELKALHQKLYEAENFEVPANQLTEKALAINSRAGTFGYTGAAEVAYMLYLFCSNKLAQVTPRHHNVIKSHIEVLQFVISGSMRGKDVGIEQIILELKRLAGNVH